MKKQTVNLVSFSGLNHATRIFNAIDLYLSLECKKVKISEYIYHIIVKCENGNIEQCKRDISNMLEGILAYRTIIGINNVIYVDGYER